MTFTGDDRMADVIFSWELLLHMTTIYIFDLI